MEYYRIGHLIKNIKLLSPLKDRNSCHKSLNQLDMIQKELDELIKRL